MSLEEDIQQWKCGKGVTVNLQRVTSIVRDIGQPCLHQSPIKVVIAITKMLKPDKWQATFDRDGKVFGFQKVLKMIILGGVDPSIRPEVWEFLLGCYELSSTDEYRKLLRSARRERYKELVEQCQMMHSSIGTGSLAYVVGSKVMDMRTSSKDEETEVETKSRGDYDGYASNSGIYSNESRNVVDISSKIESSTDSDDLISVRSTEGAAYDSSLQPASPTSDPYTYSSVKNCTEAYESNYASDNYFDFPPLPVTDLFDKRKKDRKGHRSLDDGICIRRRLRFGDDYVHSFRISNNTDLVVEPRNFAAKNNWRCRKSDSDICLDVQDPMSWSNNCVRDSRMLNNFRISDVPESSAGNVAISQGVTAGEDRVSKWLWTLHRIVVDVVRTDSHLEFYEDAKNLARMSDILAVYAWVDPATGYCQGMSDLLSPFVVLFEDNADAFWCFEMLLRRLRENFQMDGPLGVMKQLQALWHILELTDKEMFSHLSQIGAESLHFAFRMLLVLFRRELSFSESLSMWEMIWAADFDETMVSHLREHCPELLALQITKGPEVEMGERGFENSDTGLTGVLSSKNGNLEHPVSNNRALKTVSAHPFCGLTNSFWSKDDKLFISSEMSTGNGDDELPVFCVAAILIMNRQKIIRETQSLDDLIKIFNDNLLKFRVKRCIRSAIKLRKKYFYKLIKSRSQSNQFQE